MGMLLRLHKGHGPEKGQPLKETKIEKPVEEVVETTSLPETEKEPEVELEEKYTKAQLNKMALDKLRKLAAAKGIKHAGVKSGATLRKELIEVMGL